MRIDVTPEEEIELGLSGPGKQHVLLDVFLGDDPNITREQILAEVKKAITSMENGDCEIIKDFDSHLETTHIDDFLKK